MVVHRRAYTRLLKSITLIEASEQRAVFMSFLLVFLLIAAYHMLRLVRDAMASDWSNTEISVLWNIQFFLSLAFVALYGMAVSLFKFRNLVSLVYGFFAASFLIFYFASQRVSSPGLVDKSFYLWVSLFSLFHVSVFWSLMADLFSKEQSKRLLAFIYMGASAGAIVGPLIAAIAVNLLGADTLMLAVSSMMLPPLLIVVYLQRLKVTDLGNESQSVDLRHYRIGGNPLQGFRSFFSSPFLLAIALFLLLYTAISSFAYFEQTNLLWGFDRDRRTEILAFLALVVNVLTFLLGFLATGRLATKWGMPVTLGLVPLFMCAALVVLAFAPLLTVLLALQVARQLRYYPTGKRDVVHGGAQRESLQGGAGWRRRYLQRWRCHLGVGVCFTHRRRGSGCGCDGGHRRSNCGNMGGDWGRSWRGLCEEDGFACERFPRRGI